MLCFAKFEGNAKEVEGQVRNAFGIGKSGPDDAKVTIESMSQSQQGNHITLFVFFRENRP